MKKQKQIEYHGGRIKDLTELVATMVAKDPTLAKDFTRLHSIISIHREGYGKRDKCYNCARSMKITIYTADLLDALLLLAMAKQVAENLKKGMHFTDANKVHLPTLGVTQGISKRSTKCDYLGFIKQPKDWRGSGYWLLTGWAWKALGGEKVPKAVKYWEGHLIGRSEELTTLGEMFGTHTDLINRALRMRKSIKADHRHKFSDYKPSDWSDFGGYVEQPHLLK